MISPASKITQLLIATPPANGPRHVVSIGVVLDDERVFWGDCLLSSTLAEPLPTIQRLVDISTPALLGQRASSFRELCASFAPHFPMPGIVAVADAIRGAMHQAFLATVAEVRQTSVSAILADEYGFPGPTVPALNVPVLLEISDFAATAERIDRMLALRPAGISYRLTGSRVADAIGENAEYLQRFVRELGQRAVYVVGESKYNPDIYLGLNGALGQLTSDPVRHMGKILGNCVGLQDAAGSRRLILEEPFLLDDPVAQSANLFRLKDFLRLTPSSQKRVQPTRLAARAHSLKEEELRLYTDTQPVHALSFDLLANGDIDGVMTQLSTVRENGITSYISLSSSIGLMPSVRLASSAAAVALATGSAGLTLNFDGGDESLYLTLVRYLCETSTLPDHPLDP